MSSRRFYFSLVAFALVGAAAFVYSCYFAPSPPAPPPVDPIDPDDRDDAPDVETLDRVFPRLSQLFPDKNDWRRSSPNIVAPANRSVVFLFKNEPIFSQDRTQVALNACTIVFLATDERLSDEERCRQALVFESADRVVLEFTKPLADVGSLDSANFDFSSFLSGEMRGKVVLRSDMKSPGAEDDVRFQTHDLVFTEKQIRTNFEFSFNLGRNNGSGRGLTIDLDLPLDFAARNAASGASDDADPDDAFRARVDELRREGNLGCGFSIEQIELTELDGYSRFYLDDSLADAFSASSDATSTSENATPRRPADSYIDVRCKKGVYFSSNPDAFGGWCVRFNDSVEVVSYRDGAKAEQLLCGALYLYLQDPEFEKLAAERPDYRRLLERNVPTGSLARLVPTIVRAQRSPDAPSLVRVDDERVEISADEIQYDVRSRVLRLISNEETNESARLRAQTDARVDFSANAVQIQLDENHKPQTILASGTGKLDAYLRDGEGPERRVRADWQNGLRVAPDPNQPNQYKLSTQGAVAFYLDGVGTFSAREADFWAQAVETPRDNETPNAPSNARLLTNVVPIAAAFRDDVVFQAPRGDAKISDAVVVRFASAVDANETDPTVDDANASSNGVASFLAGKSTLGDEEESTFQMQARNLDLWCVLRADASQNRVDAVEINRATLRGDVTLVENAYDGSPRMRVVAKEADLVSPGTDEARVVLVGDANRAASFQMHELALSGYNVVVDRAANAFQVVGPGKLAVRPPAQSVAEPKSQSPQISRFFTDEPVEIEWAEAMTFNGGVLAFRGSERHDVLISQRTQTLRCREARFTLSQPISIFALDAKATENLDVATIEFLGDFDRPVKIDATTFGENSDAPDDAAFYQAFLQNLRYERAAERFVAQGGGALRATFQGGDASTRLQSLGALDDASANDAATNEDDKEKWTTVCLKFQDEIIGDVKTREISAAGGVRAVVCKSPRPNFELDVDVPATQPKDAVRVSGNEARVVLVDVAPPAGQAQVSAPQSAQEASFEIDLRGSVVFRRDDVFGRCDALKYVAAKNLAILSGDGSTKAALYRQEYAGATRQTLGEFSRALYRLDTNRLEVESISASGVAD